MLSKHAYYVKTCKLYSQKLQSNLRTNFQYDYFYHENIDSEGKYDSILFFKIVNEYDLWFTKRSSKGVRIHKLDLLINKYKKINN